MLLHELPPVVERPLLGVPQYIVGHLQLLKAHVRAALLLGVDDGACGWQEGALDERKRSMLFGGFSSWGFPKMLYRIITNIDKLG